MLGFDLDRFHAGNEALFAELVEEYSPRLLPQLRRYAGVDADAHDLLQDVWLRAYTRRETFDGRGSLFGWLLMVARTVGMTVVRKRERAPATVGRDDLDSLPDLEAPRGSASDAGPLRDALSQALLDLPDRQREVVILRLIEGMSTAETARALRCAEGTVKASLHQATRKLREYLKEAVR